MDLTPQGGMPYGHLEELLRETAALSKENNRILRRMERNALIGFIFKILIWLIVLGVPIYFLSSYMGPLMQVLSGSATASSTVPSGLLGLPSAEQLQKLLETYKAK